MSPVVGTTWSVAAAWQVAEPGLGIVMPTEIGRDELRDLTGRGGQLVEVLPAGIAGLPRRNERQMDGNRPAVQPAGSAHPASQRSSPGPRRWPRPPPRRRRAAGCPCGRRRPSRRRATASVSLVVGQVGLPVSCQVMLDVGPRKLRDRPRPVGFDVTHRRGGGGAAHDAGFLVGELDLTRRCRRRRR
jgi:hypothetical protein